ncbi:hypothetical protein [Nocardia alba]|uniref:Uncharacterized protein n=1 Tax=Nocardia alba TaxID=225051 RepID=A0A4R1FNC6_9NOCA|nr:hypothetical protein [Nocardia alba]TCJ95700.1 hypothetical protein DFR71_4615 [Nocardia alba]
MTDNDQPAERHRRPDGVDAATVTAVGKLSEALETTERARGHLYSFHQLTGGADLALGDAVRMLREAGHHQLAEKLADELIGRNVIAGRWTFQVVEDYDEGYYAQFRRIEREIRNELVDGRTHLYEAQMKEARRSHGRPGHEAQPEG